MTEPILGSFCELNLKRIDFEAFKGVADYPKLYNLVRNNFSSFSAWGGKEIDVNCLVIIIK